MNRRALVNQITRRITRGMARRSMGGVKAVMSYKVAMNDMRRKGWRNIKETASGIEGDDPNRERGLYIEVEFRIERSFRRDPEEIIDDSKIEDAWYGHNNRRIGGISGRNLSIILSPDAAARRFSSKIGR